MSTTIASPNVQCIFPKIGCANGGYFQFFITRDDGAPGSKPDPAFLFNPTHRIIFDKDVSPQLLGDVDLSQKLQTSEGLTSTDNFTITFQDRLDYTGEDESGNPISEDFAGVYSSVLAEFFCNTGVNDKQYWIWLVFTTVSGDVDIPFCGNIQACYKPQDQSNVAYPQTVDEQAYGTRTLQCVSVLSLFASLEWQRVREISNVALSCTNGQCYCGIVNMDGSDLSDGLLPGGLFTGVGTGGAPISPAVVHFHRTGGSFGTGFGGKETYILEGSRGGASVLRFDQGLWFIKITDLIGLICQAGSLGWTSSDIDSAFDFYRQIPDGTNKRFPVDTAAPIALTELYVSYNAIFGSHPYDGWDGSGEKSTTLAAAPSAGDSTISVNAGIPYGNRVILSNEQLGERFQVINSVDTSGVGTGPWDIVLSAPLAAGYSSGATVYYSGYWDNPLAYKPDEKLGDILRGIFDFLQVRGYIDVDQTTGVPSLKVTANGVSAGSLPTNFILVKSDELNPEQNALNVQVYNRGDDLNIVAPKTKLGHGSPIVREVPWRLRRWPSPVSCINEFGHDYPSASDLVYDANDNLPFDRNFWDCFQICDFDAPNGDTAFNVNQNVWKSLCYVYWFNASNTNVAYPTGWLPGFSRTGTGQPGGGYTWANSFYALGGLYKKGATPNANEGNNDRFNSRVYPAVAMAQLLLPQSTLLERVYNGTTADDGTLSGLRLGISGTWRYDRNPSTNFQEIELVRTLRESISKIKWRNATTALFPEITDVTYGPLSGGGSGGTSSSFGTTAGGSTPGAGGSNAIIQDPSTVAVNTITPIADIVGLTHQGISSQTSNFEEWLDSSSNVLVKIEANGTLNVSPANDIVPAKFNLPSGATNNALEVQKNSTPTGGFNSDGVMFGRLGSLVLVNGDNNNVTGTDTHAAYDITGPTADFAITGIVPTSGPGGWRDPLKLINRTAFVLSIFNESGSSTAANQIQIIDGAFINIQPGESIQLGYDPSVSRWTEAARHRAMQAVTVVAGTGISVVPAGLTPEATQYTISATGTSPHAVLYDPTTGTTQRIIAGAHGFIPLIVRGIDPASYVQSWEYDNGSSVAVLGGMDTTGTLFIHGNFQAHGQLETGGPNLAVDGLVEFANASGSHFGNLTISTLTADRTWSLPNATGTLALTSSVPTTAVITNPSADIVNTIQGAGGVVDLTLKNPDDATNFLQFLSSTGTLLVDVAPDGTYEGTSINVTTQINVGHNAIGTTSTDGLILSNVTGAAAGSQQYSPRLRLSGTGWKTNAAASSEPVDWIAEVHPVQGAAHPGSDFILSQAVNGGSFIKMMRVSCDYAGLPPTFFFGGTSSASSGAGTIFNMGEASTGAAGDCFLNGQNAGGTNQFGGNFVWQVGLSTGNKSGQSAIIRSSFAGTSGTAATVAQQLLALTPSGTAASNPVVTATFGKTSTVTGIINLCQSGAGNAACGTATLVGGTVTVSTAAVKTGDLIFVTDAGNGAANIGSLSVGSIVNATSFVISSTSPLDTSPVNWVIIRPN